MTKMNFSSALERILHASTPDALATAEQLEGRVRARVAVYCYVRNHLRSKGLAIASICRIKDLAAESSPHVAENMFTLAARLAEPEMVQQQRRSVSLACI